MFTLEIRKDKDIDKCSNDEANSHIAFNVLQIYKGTLLATQIIIMYLNNILYVC